MTGTGGLRPASRWPVSPDGVNLYDVDLNLQTFLEQENIGLDRDMLSAFGAWVSGPLEAQARYSDRFAPPRDVDVLTTAGVPGAKTKKIIFNPAYLEVQREVYRQGAIGLAYAGKKTDHLPSFVLGYLISKSDISTHCPVTLTGAVAHVLNRYAPEDVREKYLPELIRMDGQAKTGGTWVTEKHSGTNAGATACVAQKADDGTFRLYGEKWFASNADSNLALVLARPEGASEGNKGAGLYLVLDQVEGKPNTQKITGLKNKLGTRGLATVELDLNGCTAIEIAPPPHGLKIMMEALEYSRVHNAMSAAGISHRIFVEALCFTDNRAPFARPLSEEPMIRQELVDMATEWMASSALAFQAAKAFGKQDQGAWGRMMTAMAKWRTAESAVQSANNLIELIGGMAYTTDMQAERLLRDAKVLQVWEGPKQVQARGLARVIVADKNDTLYTGLKKSCDALPDSAGDLRRAIGRELHELRYNIRLLKASPEAEDQIAFALLRQASDITALTLLADEGVWELEHYGDDQKLLVARHFHEKQFGERHPVALVPGALQARFNTLSARPLAPLPSPGWWKPGLTS